MENVINDITYDNRIDGVIEYFGGEVFDSSDFHENYRKEIVTTIAYLIGVSDEKFTTELFERKNTKN